MKKRRKNNKNIIASFILVLLLCTTLIVFFQRFYQLEKECSFAALSDVTVQLGDQIREDVMSAREYLRSAAFLVDRMDMGDTERMEWLAEVLENIGSIGVLTRLELILPDGSVVSARAMPSANAVEPTDGVPSANSTPSSGATPSTHSMNAAGFEELAAQGERLSGRMKDGDGTWIACYYLPIEWADGTAAILRGVIELELFAERYSMKAMNGNAQIYLVDGDTGAFLIDTWHDKLGNMWDFKKRQSKDGYSADKLKADFRAGKGGETIFRSEKAGVYFYSSYEPVGLNNWMLMLTVPEGTATGRTHRMLLLFYKLAIVVVAILVFYFLWMLMDFRKEARRKAQELDRVSFMYEVEKLLFNAHREPSQVEKALERIAASMSAGVAFLLATGGMNEEDSQVFVRDPEGYPPGRVREKLQQAESMERTLRQTKKAVSVGTRKGMPAEISEGVAKSRSLCGICRKRWKKPEGMLLHPVLDMDGGVAGILGVCGMEEDETDAERLEWVSVSFSMYLNNRRRYSDMKRMGMMDDLTGLLNRNCYNATQKRFKEDRPPSLACIYMDANGLHEMNNCLGHEAGDQMLQNVADVLRQEFGEDGVFRIGGDEFVALLTGCTEGEARSAVEHVKQAVKRVHYSLSYGLVWQEGEVDVEQVVKTAEEKMRQDKKEYYRRKGNLRSLRDMNHRLERMLLEKQDADAFLSVISPGFWGVYFVDMLADSVRHIFIPPYFKEILDRTGGVFSKSIWLYGEERVMPEYRESFHSFCRYDRLRKQLAAAEEPEFLYQRVDGTWLRVRVFLFEKLEEEAQETLWIFDDGQAPEEEG